MKLLPKGDPNLVQYKYGNKIKELKKGRAGRVYSINREKLKEAIELLEAYAKELRAMLENTSTE